MCQEEERGDDLIFDHEVFCLGTAKRTPGQVLTWLDAKTEVNHLTPYFQSR